MRLNPTVVLTFILLALMFGAGLVSSAWGIVVGREALKGITQPDTRPANNLANRKSSNSGRENIVILKEEEIVNSVKERITGKGGPRKAIAPAAEPSPEAKSVAAANAQAQLPMVSQSQGVVLELTSLSQDGTSFVLKVNLRNTGKESVRFLYSSLKIKDEQGRDLIAKTDGLPAELASSSETYSGTISISTLLLEKVKKLSLSLTDYPDQRLQLQLSDIPVAR